MAKLTLQGGVWTAFASFVLAGLGGITVADPWTWPWYLGWASLVAAVALLLWGVRIGGRSIGGHLLRRGPPNLYLSNTPSPEGARVKSLWVEWSPRTLHLSVRGDLPFSQWPPPTPTEEYLSFDVLNAGPEDVRHVVVEWSLPGVDLGVLLLRENMLFGDCLDSIQGDRLRLISEAENRAANMTASSRVNAFPIPLIKAGDTARIQSPDAFTNAYGICALAVAKQVMRSVARHAPDLSLRAVVRYMESMLAPMTDALLTIEYSCGDQRRRQKFAVTGLVSGQGPPFSKIPQEDGSYAVEPGAIATSVTFLEVIPDGHPRQR